MITNPTEVIEFTEGQLVGEQAYITFEDGDNEHS